MSDQLYDVETMLGGGMMSPATWAMKERWAARRQQSRAGRGSQSVNGIQAIHERERQRVASLTWDELCREVHADNRRLRREASTLSERELAEIRERAPTYAKVPIPGVPEPPKPAPRPAYVRTGAFGITSYAPGPNASFANCSLTPPSYRPPKED